MNFLKKHWSNILFFVFIGLLIVPQTRMPIQVFLQQIIAFTPSEKDEADREVLLDYNWNLQKLSGEALNFSEAKGKVIVLNFWASWCPPCVAEMPSLQKLYDSYGDQVAFYFVTSEKPAKVEQFLKKKNYILPVYLQTYKAPEQLETTVLPTTYVISKTGEIVIAEEGVADWNSKKVRALLDKLLN